MAETKTLYLVRHAKSSWAEPGIDDIDRPLNSRGLHDAPEMGRRIKRRGPVPELILCSPARRAAETFEMLGLGVANVVFDERIYEASASTLLALVESLDDRYRTAMLIGHNPSISWLASQLGGVHIDHMPTGAVATIRLATSHWRRAVGSPAELVDFDYPKKPPAAGNEG